jgi:hypothetical protein
MTQTLVEYWSEIREAAQSPRRPSLPAVETQILSGLVADGPADVRNIGLLFHRTDRPDETRLMRALHELWRAGLVVGYTDDENRKFWRPRGEL